MTRIALVCGALMLWPAIAAADEGARLVGVAGDVQVVTPAGTIPARLDARVGAGDVVVTGEHASASLRLGDGSLLVLGERSRLRMTRALAGAGGDRDVSVLLEVGSLVAKVARVLGVVGLFELRTPSERVHVQSGELYLEVSPDGTTRIERRTAEIVEPGARDGGGGEATTPGPAGAMGAGAGVRAHPGAGTTGAGRPATSRTSALSSRVPVGALVPSVVQGTGPAAQATLGDLLGAATPALSLVDGLTGAALPVVQDVLDAVSLPAVTGAVGGLLPLGPLLGVRAGPSSSGGGSSGIHGSVDFR